MAATVKTPNMWDRERVWDDDLQAWTFKTDHARKVNADDPLNVQSDDKLKRLGKERGNKSTNQSPVELEPHEVANVNPDGSVTVKGTLNTGDIQSDTLKQLIQEWAGTTQQQQQSNQQQSNQQMTEQANNARDAKDKQPQGEQKDDKNKGGGVCENDIFDRWSMEVFEHFAYMVNKKNRDIHVRFPHSRFVPHLHPEINCHDVERIAEFVEDFKFMRAEKFRMSVIDPLLAETYQPVAA